MIKRLCLSGEMKDGRRADVRFLLSDTLCVGFGSLIIPDGKTYSADTKFHVFDDMDMTKFPLWDFHIRYLAEIVGIYALRDTVPYYIILSDSKKEYILKSFVSRWQEMFPESAFALDKWEVLEE